MNHYTYMNCMDYTYVCVCLFRFQHIEIIAYFLITNVFEKYQIDLYNVLHCKRNLNPITVNFHIYKHQI